MIYQVFDNDKPADADGFSQLKGIERWKTSKFKTLEEAQVYTNKWLGYDEQANLKDSLKHLEVFKLALGSPYDYSGYGDIIEIREVN